MSNQLARCLYHLTNAPIQATVVVTDNDGNRKVATTTVNQSKEKIFIEARNFTFSSPVIKVRITQASSPKKEISITCYKGQSVRLVKGVKPKCPSGYKVK
jgi:spore coat protein U-like protein